MSRLYPVRRIPQGMVLIGSVFVIFSTAVGIAHYGFGVPVHDRNRGEPFSEGTIGLILAAFAGAGILLASMGRTIIRAATRHHTARLQAGKVR